jgi:hypothetical protein
VTTIHFADVVAAVTMQRHLRTSQAAKMLATINHAEKCWVAEFLRCLYLSGNRILINVWANIPGIWITITTMILQAAPKLSEFPAGISQLGDCSIYH